MPIADCVAPQSDVGERCRMAIDFRIAIGYMNREVTLPPWAQHALTILEEGVKCHHAGLLRGALHAAYDAFTFVVETGFRLKAPINKAADSLVGHRWRLNEMSKKRPIPEFLYGTLRDLGTWRNRMAHEDYDDPSDGI